MFVFDEGKQVFVDTAIAEFGGAKFTIAQASNHKFQRIFASLQKPHRRKIDKGEMDPAESESIAIKAMAQGLVVSWEKVMSTDGKEIPYTVDTCIKLLASRPDLREFLQSFAMDLENFRSENISQMGES